MRRSAFINLGLIVLLLTACNWLPQSSPPAPTPTPVTSTAPGSAPPAAPATPTTAAPAAPVAVAPAPATAPATAPGGLQVQGSLRTNNGDVPYTLQVLGLQRIPGNMIMLRVAVTNNGTQDIPDVYGHNVLTDSYLVDTTQQKKYQVVKDAQYKALASDMLSMSIGSGQTRQGFAQFPAPPPTTTSVVLYAPGATPLFNVPVTQ